jgi:hypothetical protein
MPLMNSVCRISRLQLNLKGRDSAIHGNSRSSKRSIDEDGQSGSPPASATKHGILTTIPPSLFISTTTFEQSIQSDIVTEESFANGWLNRAFHTLGGQIGDDSFPINMISSTGTGGASPYGGEGEYEMDDLERTIQHARERKDVATSEQVHSSSNFDIPKNMFGG